MTDTCTTSSDLGLGLPVHIFRFLPNLFITYFLPFLMDNTAALSHTHCIFIPVYRCGSFSLKRTVQVLH